MDKIKIFEKKEFGQIRVVEINNNLYSVGIDVAKALGYKNPNDAITRHCKGYVKHAVPTNSGKQKMNVISEGDVYRLVANSKLPSSVKFEAWMFDEVIPSIRKNGAYMTPETIEKTLSDPDFIIGLAQKLKEEQRARAIAEKQLLVDKPKVLFADAVTASKTSILVGELAKILKQNGIHTGQNRLFDWLRNKGYLIRRKGTDYNMPTQRSMELGLFEVKETSITHSDGHISVNKTPKVTGKGQVYFIKKFMEVM